MIPNHLATAECPKCPLILEVPIGHRIVHYPEGTHDFLPLMTQAEMYDRDGHACLACGAVEALTEQHRYRKGMGGVRGVGEHAVERPSNRCTLCYGCNNAAEADHRFQLTCIRNGWKLKGGEDPSKIAVFVVARRTWHLLDDVGGYRVVDEREPGPEPAPWGDVA
jgi:hypothetical protein